MTPSYYMTSQRKVPEMIRSWAVLLVVLAMALGACSSDDGDGEGADGASISFAGVEDGDTVSSPLAVTFESEDFEVVPAGEGGEGTGHMHVMIDVGCVPVGETIPSDDSHVHFGDGSTSADLELEPGEHELCLQAGDANHAALDLTDEITVTVE